VKSRIRVAQIVTRFMAGAGGVALRGALALDPERYEIVFIIGSGDRLIHQAKEAEFEIVPVDNLRSEIAPVADFAALHELTSILSKGKFDIVHTHSAKAGTLGRLAACRAGVQGIVHTFHGFPFHEFQSHLRRQIYISIERFLGQRTGAFLAVGSAVAAEAIRRDIAPPEKVRTIGVAVPMSPPPCVSDRAEARRLLGVPLGMHVVGTVGRLDFQKAPEIFIEALARMRRSDVFGVWVGDGPLRPKMEKLVDRQGLAEHFAFLGDRADVSRLLPGFDVFAMASRYEGLPCAIVEAMGASLPVVATAVNAVPNIVIPGETGLLVPPARSDLLCNAISHLVDHPNVGERMGRAGRSSLGSDMTPSALGTILDSTYESLLQPDHANEVAVLEHVS
jgi:glycosyltransferase involved in cell wall biosynthesis